MSSAYFRISYKMLAMVTLGVLTLLYFLAWSEADVVLGKPYRSMALGIELKIPTSWAVLEKETAIRFTGPARDQKNAVFAILKNITGGTFTEAGIQAMMAAHPSDWVSTDARFAGKPAIKIVGSDKQDPSLHLVQYFVPADQGHFVIYCLAPLQDWKMISPTFTTAILSTKFLTQRGDR